MHRLGGSLARNFEGEAMVSPIDLGGRGGLAVPYRGSCAAQRGQGRKGHTTAAGVLCQLRAAAARERRLQSLLQARNDATVLTSPNGLALIDDCGAHTSARDAFPCDAFLKRLAMCLPSNESGTGMYDNLAAGLGNLHCSSAVLLQCISSCFYWRKRWDSNPRTVTRCWFSSIQEASNT
jgi:hypothetical protein